VESRPGDVLVFASEAGGELDAANVRRAFRRVTKTAGLDAAAWTPRELRHGLVSILSDATCRSSTSRGWWATAEGQA
jgi:site-specific recombinase XerD